MVTLVLTIPMIPSHAAYGVDVGDTFSFTINQASGDFRYKTNVTTIQKTATGYALGENTISVGSGLTINVTAVSGSSVTINSTSGSIEEESLLSGLSFGWGMFYTILLPFLVLALSSGTVPDFVGDYGVSLFGDFLGEWMFIAPSDTDWLDLADNFNTTAEDIGNSTDPDYDFDFDVSSGATFENNLEEFRLWMVITGTIINATENTDMTLDHRLMFAYEVDTGVLLGYRYTDDFSGTIEGSETTFKMSLEVVRDTYTLPAFPGGGGFLDNIPSFEWFLILPALGLLGLLLIIRKKR